jgi:cytoskeleton protein RodZ
MIEHEPDPLRRIPVKHADVRAEVGAVLRAARLKRGQSLENVAEQTRIPKRYIDALECDRLDEFPAFVYMRGFMKSYCDHLDLPFDEIWARVQATVPGQAPASAAAPAAPASPVAPSAPNARPAAARAPEPRAHAPASAAPAPAPAAERPRSSAAGAVALSLALGVGVTIWVLRDRAASPPPKPAESTPRALLPVSKPVETRVVVRAVDDCWARVAVDGNAVFEGRIPRGAMMDWTPTKTLTLHATVPESLQVTVNGAPHPLGAPSADGEYRIDVLP